MEVRGQRTNEQRSTSSRARGKTREDRLSFLKRSGKGYRETEEEGECLGSRRERIEGTGRYEISKERRESQLDVNRDQTRGGVRKPFFLNHRVKRRLRVVGFRKKGGKKKTPRCVISRRRRKGG